MIYKIFLNYAKRLERESPLSLWCRHAKKAKEDFRQTLRDLFV